MYSAILWIQVFVRRQQVNSQQVIIHLLCVCIGADSGDSVDSADSTFSVTGLAA